MNKIMKGLGTIVLALGAGCASQQPKPTGITHELLANVEQTVIGIDADRKRTKAETQKVSELYALVSGAQTAKDADEKTKEHYAHILKILSEMQKDNYNNMNFSVGFTGIDTEQFSNIPGNVGITRPLDQVTGTQLVKALGEKRAYELISQLKPVEKYTGLPVTPGPVNAGGQRIVGLEGIAVEMTMEEAKKVVGERLGRLTGKRLTELTDGNRENGEMYKAWLVAETCKGYDLPKPADTK